MIIKELFKFIFDFFENELPTERMNNLPVPELEGANYSFFQRQKKLYISYNNFELNIGYDPIDKLFWIRTYSKLSLITNTYEYEIHNRKLSAYVNSKDDFVDIENYIDFNDIDKLTEEEILYLSLKYDKLGEYFV